MGNNKKRLIVIDSNSIIHRAYHALPFFNSKKGENVGAIYGFLLVFFKAIKDFQPDFIAAAFDFPAPTFRHKKYRGYKAKRPPTPREIYQQTPKIREILKTFNVPIFEKQGLEADDIIGAITILASKGRAGTEIETIILSSDSDMFQLVNHQTKVYALRKGVKDVILYDGKLVKEKFHGLEPKQLLDFKALRGDPSDNIPGVVGVGEKTATNLILEFSSLKNLYYEIEKESGRAQKIKPRLREVLIKNKKKAFFSKMLVGIKTDALIDFNLEKCIWRDYNKEKVIKSLENLEFYSLIKKLSLLSGTKICRSNPISPISQKKLF